MAAQGSLLRATVSLVVIWLAVLFVVVFGVAAGVSSGTASKRVTGGPLAGATISGAVGAGLNMGTGTTISGSIGAALGWSEGQPDT